MNKVKGKVLLQLLSGPLRGRAGGHIEVQNATPVMAIPETRKGSGNG